MKLKIIKPPQKSGRRNLKSLSQEEKRKLLNNDIYEYRKHNIERCKQSQKKWYDKNGKAYHKAWYKKNKKNKVL